MEVVHHKQHSTNYNCLDSLRLKYAVMKPLYKKGDKADMANYRPIYMLTVFSKVLENTMYHRLNQHLQVNNLVLGKTYQLIMLLFHLPLTYFRPGMINF
jgi:hypothetical protein